MLGFFAGGRVVESPVLDSYNWECGVVFFLGIAHCEPWLGCWEFVGGMYLGVLGFSGKCIVR